MRRLLVPLLVSLAACAVAVAPAQAKKKPSCAKLVKRAKQKVVKHTGGITIYRSGTAFGICSDKTRKLDDFGSTDGQKLKTVLGAGGRCAVLLLTGGGQLPNLVFKDVKQPATSSVLQVGYGATSAVVQSLALSKNCGVAWGDAVDGAFHVRAYGITKQSDLTTATTDVATVPAESDLAKVTIKAKGKQVVVGYTSGGVPQTAVLPAA